MSILDQLRNEVAEKKLQEINQNNLTEQRQQCYENQILPVMQKTFRFMKELVEHLNVLQHTIPVNQYSEKYAKLGPLTQKDYKISTHKHGGFSDINELKLINIRYLCVGNEQLCYNVEGQVHIEHEVAFLTARHMHYEWEYFNGRVGIRSARFKVTPKIPVRFKFEVDFDNSNILLNIDNHENFRSYKQTLAAEEIDDTFLDRVASYLLRKDTLFKGEIISKASFEAHLIQPIT